MLIKYEDWRLMQESSPLTRQMLGWGRMGSYPLRADFMSHSTPPPDIMNKLIDTFGTAKVDEKKLTMAINELFDMRPKAIIQRLDLLKPMYSETAAYGHFGRTSANGFTWEKTDMVAALKGFF
jgi:hypothetical protein